MKGFSECSCQRGKRTFKYFSVNIYDCKSGCIKGKRTVGPLKCLLLTWAFWHPILKKKNGIFCGGFLSSQVKNNNNKRTLQ